MRYLTASNAVIAFKLFSQPLMSCMRHVQRSLPVAFGWTAALFPGHEGKVYVFDVGEPSMASMCLSIDVVLPHLMSFLAWPAGSICMHWYVY